MDDIKSKMIEADEPFNPQHKPSPVFGLLLPNASPLLRKFGRGLRIYALSYGAVQILDAATRQNPNNKFIAGADEIADVTFAFENMLVDGTVTIAKASYDAMIASESTVPPVAETKAPVPQHKHHRNRANLSATLAPGDLPAPAKAPLPPPTIKNDLNP